MFYGVMPVRPTRNMRLRFGFVAPGGGCLGGGDGVRSVFFGLVGMSGLSENMSKLHTRE